MKEIAWQPSRHHFFGSGCHCTLSTLILGLQRLRYSNDVRMDEAAAQRYSMVALDPAVLEFVFEALHRDEFQDIRALRVL